MHLFTLSCFNIHSREKRTVRVNQKIEKPYSVDGTCHYYLLGNLAYGICDSDGDVLLPPVESMDILRRLD